MNPFSDPDYGASESFITGWTATVPTGHTVTFYSGTSSIERPTPVDGSYLYNVGGFGREKGFGTIYQDFATSPGQQYQLLYYVSGISPQTDPVTSFTQVFDVVSGSTSGPALGSENAVTSTSSWTQFGFVFTAVGTDTRLMFTDAQTLSGIHNPGVSGTANQLNIDAVSVTAIPEPSTYAAMAGAAMLGLAIYRRRRVAAPVAA